jgi:hypothetical protein
MSGGLNRRLALGRWLGLEVTISPIGIVSFLGVVPLSMVLSIWLGQLDFGSALWSGLLTALIFFLSDYLHQYGHSLAAKWVGYPMQGMFFFTVFSGSQYPKDEPTLPPTTHIRRALGGFWVNVILGALLGAAANSVWGSALGWALLFSAVWNFFILGWGALFPIDIQGFTTDGATIWKNWQQSRMTQIK